MLFNARSVYPKFDDLCVTVSNYKPSVIMVTESWLTDCISDDLIALDRYHLFRSDRLDRRGGGVCTWILDSFQPRRIIPSNTCPSSIEAVFCVHCAVCKQVHLAIDNLT